MTITIDDLVERARGLRPVVAGHEQDGELDRRVADEVIDAINGAGLFRIMTPKRYGGYETDIRTHLAVSAEIAKADAAAAWVTALTNVCAWVGGTFSNAAQDEIWGENPDARIAGVLAPTSMATPADGGLVVDGAWSFASGSLHAQWGIGGVPILSDTGDLIDQKVVCYRMSEVSIEDTWHTAGMRGTGSNTVVANDVFVPDHRMISVFQALGGVYPTEHTDEVLYRSAMVPVLAIILVGPMLGMATRALELVCEQAVSKPMAYTFYAPQASSQVFQHQLAEAASKIETAHLHAFRCADTIDADARAGRFPDRVSRARARQDTGWAARHCKEALDILMTLGGAGSFAEASPLQKIWRDLNTAARHAIVSPGINQEVYGRALLGVEETATPLV